MAAHDPKDDVDRLFACFKCGVSPPRKLLDLENGDFFPFPPQISDPALFQSGGFRVGVQGEAAAGGQEVAGSVHGGWRRRRRRRELLLFYSYAGRGGEGARDGVSMRF
jgi:hypothetical protein